MADKTPTWHGRHGEGAKRAHREKKRKEAEERNGINTAKTILDALSKAADEVTKNDNEYFDA